MKILLPPYKKKKHTYTEATTRYLPQNKLTNKVMYQIRRHSTKTSTFFFVPNGFYFIFNLNKATKAKLKNSKSILNKNFNWNYQKIVRCLAIYNSGYPMCI